MSTEELRRQAHAPDKPSQATNDPSNRKTMKRLSKSRKQNIKEILMNPEHQ